MWKRLTAMSAIAAAISAAPAYAQQTPADPANPPAATQQAPDQSEQPQAGESGQNADLLGSTVTSADGKDIGTVAKVNQSADGKIQSLNVEMGSMLGIGGKTVEVFPDQYTETENGIELTLTAEAAEALPESKTQ